MIYVPVVVATFAFLAAMLPGIVKNQDTGFAVLFVFALSAFALLIGLILSLVVGRPVTVFREQRRYFWLQGMPDSFLDEVSDICDVQVP